MRPMKARPHDNSIRRDVAASCLMALTALSGPAWAEEPEAQRRARATPAPQHAGTLPAVVVTATAAEREAADAPASVTVIDGAALRRQPVLDRKSTRLNSSHVK